MKRLKLIPTILLMILGISCADYLDVVPDNVATIDYAFRNRESAEKYLATCYSYLPDFGYIRDPAMMGSDEIWSHDIDRTEHVYQNTYYLKLGGRQNVSDPLLNFWDGRQGGTNLFIGIRDCNIFLENIYIVPDITEAERKQWIAEVKFLKAFYHFYLMRLYGPIPIIRENIPIHAGIEDVQVFREPVDEVVGYIVELINEAVPDLPLVIYDRITSLGRITQPIALAVKADVLVTAASPLYNGNTIYSDFVDSRGIQLINQKYDREKWGIAMQACKNAIDTAHLASHALYRFIDLYYGLSEETHRIMTLRNAFTEKWNEEVIWGYSNGTFNALQRHSMPYFTHEQMMYIRTAPDLGPSIHIAEQFYSKNGVPIDEDETYDYDNRFKTSTVSSDQKYYIQEDFETAILHQYREPRFYASIAFDGGIWFGNGRYKDVGKGTADETSWVVKNKIGDPSGRASDWRYSKTGYYTKKWVHYQTTVTTSAIVYSSIVYPIYRLADLYLLYAEARNEYSGPDSEVYDYIDMVRERAGLKGVLESWEEHSKYPDKPKSKDGLRNIIRQERLIELAFEGKRFYDIRRWKIADQILNQPVRGWNMEGRTTEEYYHLVTFGELVFSTKDYFWPMRQYSLRQNSNLIQNPYW
ncbi:RagB/SusD family nutrient uptake outer membrane protein [Gaoshiqia sp. Z1-71]|uniref:RagB/SusD family nutrient uptake outer membrane protein n=1 Tax=Gaoshiqia hydrogeniformans TaxID=3290090 RepID=UPI003BF7EEE9